MAYHDATSSYAQAVGGRSPRMPHRHHTRTRAVLSVLLGFALLIVTLLSASSVAPACGACHAMRPYARTLEKSRHARIGCYTCHLSAKGWDWPAFKAVELTRMYPRAFEGRPIDGPLGRVSDAVCLDCHGDVLRQVSTTGRVRIDHRACATDDACDVCHRDTAHPGAMRSGFDIAMEDCISCHRTNGASSGCDVCHEDRSPRDRLASEPWRDTHGSRWGVLHGHGDLRFCSMCHPAADCSACHGFPSPHDEVYLETHVRDATSEADERCITCHETSACQGCHTVHTAAKSGGQSSATTEVDDPR